MAKRKYDEWKKPKKIALVQSWAEEGLSEKQIADKMGIAYSTLREWKKSYPAFSAALKKSKEIANKKVELTLYEKSIGYTKKVKKPIKVKEVTYKDGKRLKEIEHIEYVEEEIYYPPDTTAMIFFLKNRMPKDWKNDPHLIKLKEKDLELKKKKIEQDEW